MSKRSQDIQLTKDDDEVEVGDNAGQFTKAGAQELKKRRIVSVKKHEAKHAALSSSPARANPFAKISFATASASGSAAKPAAAPAALTVEQQKKQLMRQMLGYIETNTRDYPRAVLKDAVVEYSFHLRALKVRDACNEKENSGAVKPSTKENSNSTGAASPFAGGFTAPAGATAAAPAPAPAPTFGFLTAPSTTAPASSSTSGFSLAAPPTAAPVAATTSPTTNPFAPASPSAAAPAVTAANSPQGNAKADETGGSDPNWTERYAVRAMLYRQSDGEDTPKFYGTHALVISTSKENGKSRMIMRNEVKKIMLNLNIEKGMPFEKKVEKGGNGKAKASCFFKASENGTQKRFYFRVKPENVDALYNILTELASE